MYGKVFLWVLEKNIGSYFCYLNIFWFFKVKKFVIMILFFGDWYLEKYINSKQVRWESFREIKLKLKKILKYRKELFLIMGRVDILGEF